MSKETGWLFEGPSGSDRKDAGQAQVLANEHELWKAEARRLLLELAASGIPFSAEDLRVKAAKIGLNDPHHPNCWGAVFTAASREKLIKPAHGRKKNRIHSAHARTVGLWTKA